MEGMIYSLCHLPWPFLDTLQYVHSCLVLSNPELYTPLQVWLTIVEQTGRILSFDLLTILA